MKPTLYVIIPCYNEQDNVVLFFETCQKVFACFDKSPEYIFINDGSKDKTWEKLREIKRRDSNVKLINLSRNFGKEAAMYAGLQKATGEYVTIIDADLQQRPEVVLEMIRVLEENTEYDCVAAYQENRIESKSLQLFKKIFYRLINSMCEIDFKSGASDFRTFRFHMVQSILEVKEYFRFSKGIFSWVGYNTYFMPYIAQERNAGTSKWSFIKLFKYAVEGIVAFTTFPLKLAIYIGTTQSVISLLYKIFVILQKIIYGIDIPGYPTLVVLILLLGGVQMILLGIIGLYISKIYIQGKNRPIYIIKEYEE